MDCGFRARACLCGDERPRRAVVSSIARMVESVRQAQALQPGGLWISGGALRSLTGLIKEGFVPMIECLGGKTRGAVETAPIPARTGEMRGRRAATGKGVTGSAELVGASAEEEVICPSCH